MVSIFMTLADAFCDEFERDYPLRDTNNLSVRDNILTMRSKGKEISVVVGRSIRVPYNE